MPLFQTTVNIVFYMYLTMTTSHEKAHHALGLLKQSKIFKCEVITQLNMEDKFWHVTLNSKLA